MAVHKMLGIDLGATSGRGIVCEFDGKRIVLSKEHRFRNNISNRNGTLFWDFPALMQNIKLSVALAASEGANTLGVDTWGLDFGLLDQNGALLENPVSYRDCRTNGVPEKVFAQIGKRALYQRSGIQFLDGNTLFQLMSIKFDRPELLEQADKLLMIPDLIQDYLCGEMMSEYSISSTTQLLNAGERDWDWPLIAKLGIPEKLFSPIVMPGSCASELKKSVLRECGTENMTAIRVAGHDTASAVIAVPTTEEQFAYISSGTWSVFGTERQEALTHELSFADNWSNEGGHGGTIRYCRSLMGMWMFEECRKQNAAIASMRYEEIMEAAGKAEAFRSIIDPELPLFAEKCDMIGLIQSYCRHTRQPIPETPGALLRCIFESMALNYKDAYQALCRNTDTVYSGLHILGGGSKNAMLNQMAADAVGIPVIAGPGEATVCGNVFEQLLYRGYLSSLKEFRTILAEQLDDRMRFMPQRCPAWEDAYAKFRRLRERKQEINAELGGLYEKISK